MTRRYTSLGAKKRHCGNFATIPAMQNTHVGTAVCLPSMFSDDAAKPWPQSDKTQDFGSLRWTTPVSASYVHCSRW